jgi:hypothetical protein
MVQQHSNSAPLLWKALKVRPRVITTPLFHLMCPLREQVILWGNAIAEKFMNFYRTLHVALEGHIGEHLKNIEWIMHNNYLA